MTPLMAFVFHCIIAIQAHVAQSNVTVTISITDHHVADEMK